MNETVETNKGGLWVGLVIGGAIGAVSSLLIAPQTGAKLRKNIWSMYRTWQDKTTEIASTLCSKTDEVTSKISDKTEDIASKMSNKTEEIASSVSDTSKSIADYVSQKTAEIVDKKN
ncbi:hypothetical protein A8709_09835 [Paenibacillus pectinilyticus]|uniref:Gas vesicle protein n=1 Tax=Paenibacillus pectinilyticus TaxID=512399 RepID=A0A1C1A5T9_9BACL|nr:YtxH domain-containing protein [Paenibacillus pectinilyticus]OCT15915.1 hypothetical protein A8709_09835 [Paenibacillus pectinilyticus]